ncbi:ddt domain-containing protein [Zymoseptoria brevis]|uniref:Ddt domain-containing protein n=1 Tax=Zymoseptoria brevis TaxID=1047168 RepID=A0A0F4GS54_9PEZI|nr:ddt domain-containing protein [Zymoseptoria brevis]
MVLNKRKPVHLIPQPTNLTDTTEVYVMKGTDEVFTDYEKYIKRFDWLNQKKFTDAVNGKSGLTYWDALQSETKSSKVIENVFPEVLRDPILRKVQFSTISRMDELVNTIFDEFKHDFFPGEDVSVLFDSGEQLQGVIREKAKFPMIRAADGSIQREPFSRYFVRISESSNDEALADDKHIRRDRKVFTKQNLRSFLKNSLQREAWTGAPWLVKEHLAIHYRLPMEIPAHLLQDARLLMHKQQALAVRPPKGRKSKNLTAQDFSRMSSDEARIHMNHQQQHPGAAQHQQVQNNAQVQIRPPAPPPIKYPIEDLDVAPKRNGVTRPELKFFTEEMEKYVRGNRKTSSFQGIDMESLGMLLEVWNTLNVQCEVYVLDSFTFDDFVDAMSYSNLDTPCELLDEIHCAVLKLFLDKDGNVTVKDLPKKPEEGGDESEVQDESEVSTPAEDVPARSTRSRLSIMESAADTLQSPGERGNRAAGMLSDRDWKERLFTGEFEDGGWQVILVGVLYQLSLNSRFKDRCNEILAELAPMEMEPNQQTALVQYADLDIKLRISALQMLTILTIRTETVKTFLETCMEDMTDVRKKKIELQRAKKAAAEEFAAKDQERRILLPEHMPESPKLEESVVSVEHDITEDTIELNGGGSTDGDDEAAANGRSLRRGNDRKRKRDEEAARREKIKAEKAEAAKKETKAAKEFRKLVNEVEELRKKIIHLEEQIDECDSDLREANVQRTKVLGKDRYCNRYYWFERNGQPFGGLPTSSTSSYGYANGRIWVQGPDDMEREGFIDRPKPEQNEYHARFRCTVPERRQQEEGATILANASEWGFYDNPDHLDALIGWLDERGERERALRKELMAWRDKIVQYMNAYHDFVASEEKKKVEEEETKEVALATRINTRHKVAEEKAEDVERCCRWTNTMALTELEHIHSRPGKGKEKKGKKGVAVPVSRSGKPATRQGERYKF